MKTVEANELPDVDKAGCYEAIFGNESKLYSALQRADMKQKSLQMITMIGVEETSARFIAGLVESNPTCPQDMIDALYNAVLWLHKLNSESN